MTRPERKDRFDIQVMRGVAVLAVVIFHAFPGAFPQGFLGVDVFFVISGFLITGIILKGLESGRFSFWSFYRRRALRLLPASLVTLGVTTALAFVFLTSSQMVDYAKQLLGSLAFAANFVLAFQTGYFDAAAETKPLLHIWSLSLEEQFYFLAPFLLWLTPLRARPWLLATGFVLSLALCLVLVTGPAWLPITAETAGTFAFFMLPSRAWELLAGSLCAWLMLRRPGLTVPAWAKYLALAVIPVTCVVGFDTAHPRWDAVIVVAATSVLLLGRDGWLPKMALTRPVGAIGDWSYSLYLIHWPLFAFAYVTFGEEPPAYMLIGLAVLAVGLAYLQWRYVEQKCRDGLPFRLKAPLVLGGVMAGLVVAVAPTMGATSPLAPQLKNAAGLGKVCNEKTGKWSNRPVCRTSDTPTVAVWGDSYAMQWVPGLEGVPLVQMTKSACSPVAGVAHVTRDYPEAWARECASFNDSALAAIEAMPSVRYVVLGSPFTQVMKDGGQRLLVDGQIQPFSAAARVRFAETLERLRAAGKTPIVVGPTPYATFDAGQCNERRAEHKPIFGRSACDIGEVAAREGNAAVYEALEEAGAEPLSPATVLCADGRCVTSRAGKLLYRDQGHLTPAGARLVMEGLGVRARLLQD
jgi:peptidoglycan/LPS O-acetylase OafA/YrhL